jgi:hypothetical protein
MQFNYLYLHMMKMQNNLTGFGLIRCGCEEKARCGKRLRNGKMRAEIAGGF